MRLPSPLFAPDAGAGADSANGANGAAPPPSSNSNAGGEGGPGEIAYSALVESITDQNLRSTAERFGSFSDVVGTVAKLRQDLSDRIRIPSAKATPEDVAKFRKALGVPGAPEEYQFAPPEGVEFDDNDKAIVEAFRPIAHKYNVPQAAFAEFMSELTKMGGEIRQNITEEVHSFREETQALLDKEWGSDKAKNINFATRASKAHGGDKFIDFLNQTKLEGGGLLGDHPDMVKFLATVGRKSDEADMIVVSSQAEKQSAKERIDQILKENPVGSPNYTSPAVQRELADLYKKVAGENPITGLGAR